MVYSVPSLINSEFAVRVVMRYLLPILRGTLPPSDDSNHCGLLGGKVEGFELDLPEFFLRAGTGGFELNEIDFALDGELHHGGDFALAVGAFADIIFGHLGDG